MSDYSELKRLAKAANGTNLLWTSDAIKSRSDFAAAASPSVILAILAELDALRAANKMFTYGRGRQA